MEAAHLAAADPAAQAAPTGARPAVAALSAGLAGLQGPRTPLKPPATPQMPPKTGRISGRFQPWCAGMRGSGTGLTGSRAAQGTLPTGPSAPRPAGPCAGAPAAGGASGCPPQPGKQPPAPPEVSRTDGGRAPGCCRPRRPGRPDRCPARCRRPQRRSGVPAGPPHPAETSGETPNTPKNRPDFWEVSAMVRGQAGLRARSDRLQGGPGHRADGPVRWGGACTTTGGASGRTRSVGQIK